MDVTCLVSFCPALREEGNIAWLGPGSTYLCLGNSRTVDGICSLAALIQSSSSFYLHTSGDGELTSYRDSQSLVKGVTPFLH